MDHKKFKAPFLRRMQIWEKADALRTRFPSCATLPVPVLDLAEFDLGLELVPKSGLRQAGDIESLLLGEDRRMREQLLWLAHLKEIARVGVQDAGIFDLRSGKITGGGGSFLIDESLLSQAAFIREGEFSDTKGKPVFRIVGKVQPTGTAALGGIGKTQIIKTKGIRASDIILAFLNSEKLDDPQAFFTQICYESSAFLPFYFLLDQAKFNLKQALDMVEKEPSTLAAKTKLLARIEDDKTLRVNMPSTGTESGQRKLKLRQAMLDQKLQSNMDKRSLCDLLTMIRTVPKQEFHATYVKKTLRGLFNQNYAKGDSGLNHEIRRSVCYADWLLNRRDALKAASV